jgi:transposase
MGRRTRDKAVHVVTTTRRVGDRVYHSHLLCHSYREGGKVKKETVGNLSHLPEPMIEIIRGMLAGETYYKSTDLTVEDTRPHGHVEATIAMMRRLEFARLLERQPSRQRDLIVGLVAQRILKPDSKLGSTRLFETSTLGEELGLGPVDVDELYAAMDWLGERQEAIEKRLARRHLSGGEYVLYDVSSSYFEGTQCPLAVPGYSRDKRRGSLQLIYGLTCDREGRPIAIEAFAGNTVDAKTVAAHIEKVRTHFGLTRMIFVGDRGMVTRANLQGLTEAGFDWITALRGPQVKHLAATGALPPSLFEEHDLAEISYPDYPGERLVVCRNPLLGEQRRQKRETLLSESEKCLQAIAVRVAAGRLRGQKIGLAVGKVIDRYKMGKHFILEIDDARFAYRRNAESIASEAALDGIYILRTSVDANICPAPDVVRSYKQLSSVEQAFRSLKSIELQIRPIYHFRESRVRAHLFLCMLAYYVKWHLDFAWAELLFKDATPLELTVAKAQASPEAQRKASTQRTLDGQPVHSFATLIDTLALRARNTMRIAGTPATFTQDTQPKPLQARALELIRQLPLPSSSAV